MSELDLGLNLFQILQNQLITREGNRSTLGLGYRLHILEVNLQNLSAKSQNARVWMPYHAVAPITGMTPASREQMLREHSRLLSHDRKGSKGDKDLRDPSKNLRELEEWKVCDGFPRTVGDFIALRHERKSGRSVPFLAMRTALRIEVCEVNHVFVLTFNT